MILDSLYKLKDSPESLSFGTIGELEYLLAKNSDISFVIISVCEHLDNKYAVIADKEDLLKFSSFRLPIYIALLSDLEFCEKFSFYKYAEEKYIQTTAGNFAGLFSGYSVVVKIGRYAIMRRISLNYSRKFCIIFRTILKFYKNLGSYCFCKAIGLKDNPTSPFLNNEFSQEFMLSFDYRKIGFSTSVYDSVKDRINL